MHQCSMCTFFSPHRQDFISHLLKRHRNDPNFKVHCSYPGCGTSFKSYNSFQMHYKRKHPFSLESNENEEIVNDGMEEIDTENDEAMTEACSIDTKAMDAQFLLRLRAGFNLSNAAVGQLILSTRTLFTERLQVLKEKLLESVPQEIIQNLNIQELSEETLFENLDTEYLQEQYFVENFGYIKPYSAKLGQVQKHVKLRGQYRLTQKEVYGYCVPFMKQLEQLLLMPEVKNCLEEEVMVTDKMTDFFDGTWMRNQYFQDHPDALLICLYFDDFEIANPIGAHKKKHKLSAFYWSLLNISPELRFKLQATQLLAIAKTSYLKKFGLNSILADFIGGMQKLHGGVHMYVGREQKIVFGTLYCVLGDTLAAQLIGGFKEGVGFAEKPCRTCEISHHEIGLSLEGNQFPLKNLQEHIDRWDYLEELNKTAGRYWSRKYGVTYSSPLLQIENFDVTKAILHDPMHVLLQGIVKLELQLMLSDMIYKKHFFSLKDLNTAIRNFNYSPLELNDKPQEIVKKSLDRKNVLPMTAIEIKKFLILLPFMIGDQIPEDDNYWQNFLRLIKITLLLISPIASEETIDSLHVLIYEHNMNFKKLYPDVDLTPKLHFLTHFPEQIRMMGPARNHWCVRFEAKHNLFKSKKWKNFRAIEKSVAFYHQRWMCLQQSTNSKQKSEVYLYQGDTVGQGVTIPSDNISAEAKQKIESHTTIPKDILSTKLISIRDITYTINDVILLSCDEEPMFGIITHLYVVDHMKFIEVERLNITDFNSHINSFQCMKSNRKSLVLYNDLIYKWPQKSHFYKGCLHVMLYNVDFTWNC